MFDSPMAGMVCSGFHGELLYVRQTVAGMIPEKTCPAVRFQRKEGTMSSKNSGNLSLFEKVLVGGCLVAMGTYWSSETMFTMSVVGVTVMALVALFWEILS